MVATIEADGVGGLQPGHGAAEVVLRCANEQMVVIGHPTEGVQTQAEPLDGFGEGVQELLAVGAVAEDGVAFVAAGHDVIDGAFEFSS